MLEHFVLDHVSTKVLLYNKLSLGDDHLVQQEENDKLFIEVLDKVDCER